MKVILQQETQQSNSMSKLREKKKKVNEADPRVIHVIISPAFEDLNEV